ncbi:MAG: DUF4328 domain-containing protein [Actinomadura rubrobrunea]|nr:DUF4328 domain-containing protein [Actinomadura rubrobrunea]
MPCALCGDIIPTDVARCPACGAWARRRDFRAIGMAVFMLLGFNAFVALGCGLSLVRLEEPLRLATRDTFDAAATGRALAPYSDVFLVCGVLAGITGLLYLAWLWRAHRQSGPHRYGRVWVLLGWFTPVVNLWLPARLVYDVWLGSGRPLRPAERHAAGLVVAAWWSSVLLGVALARVFTGAGVQSLAEARFCVHVGVAAAACQALAAALCMATVFHITRLQLDGG